MSASIVDQLDSLELFKGLSFAELTSVSRHLGYVQFAAGEVIFNEGEPGGYLLILLSGSVSVFKTGEHAQHLLSSERKGRVIGEMALLDQELRSASCIADTRCELVTLSIEELNRLVLQDPSTAYRLMFSLARLLSKRLRRTSGLLAEYLSA